jgi:hypothetical protein
VFEKSKTVMRKVNKKKTSRNAVTTVEWR